MVDDTHVALRAGLHDVQFLLFVQQLDVSGLVGGYIARQADDFLLGVGQFGDLAVDFLFGAFQYREFVQYGFIGRVFRRVHFHQPGFFGTQGGNLAFDVGQAFQRAFGFERNVQRTRFFAVGVQFVFGFLQGFLHARQLFADECQAAGGYLYVAFAVLADIIVGDRIEDDAGFFRVRAGIRQVDNRTGFAFADDRQLFFDVFDGRQFGEFGQGKLLAGIGQDTVNL